MTHFAAPAQNTVWPNPIPWPDERICHSSFRWNTWDRVVLQPWGDGILWPNSRFAGCGDFDNGWAPLFGSCSVMDGTWEHPSVNGDESGIGSYLKIRGTTRDGTGNPLGSVIVQVFRTSDDRYVSQCTSDGGGYYEACTPYPSVNHYLVCYKAGAPAVAGTSVNTLQPS